MIGLDIGNGNTKWTTDGKIVYTIPSVVSTAYFGEDDDEIFTSSRSLSELALEWKDGEQRKRFIVGERALREDSQATRTMAADRISRDEFKALLGAVILATSHEEQKVIFSGLPYTATKEQREKFRQMILEFRGPLKGLAGSIKGHRWLNKIVSANVFRQAEAMIFDAVFQIKDDKIVPIRDQVLLEIPGTRVAVVDIGYGTTDVIVCEILPEFKVIKELSFTLPLAVNTVGNRISREFQRQFGEDRLDSRRLDYVIRGQKITHGGQILDLSPIRDQTIKSIGGQIRDQIAEKWGQAIRSIHVAYLGGGGAELFQNTMVGQIHPNVFKIEDPQGSNARGYFKMQYFLNIG